MKRKIKFITFILSLMILIIGCTACSSVLNFSNGEYPVKVADYTFNQQPDSIVCLDDSVADVLIACGFSDSITARSDECTQEELASIKSVGSKDSPNANKILDEKPDVVFSDRTLSDDVRKKLEDNNVSVITMLKATNNSELATLYESVGAIAGGEKTGRKTAQEKANSVITTMNDLQRIVPESDIVITGCYIYDTSGKSASEDTFCGKLFSYANITNVCANNSDNMLDKIKVSNPQYIFCEAGLKQQLSKDENFKNLNAVIKGNVYEIDSRLFERQGNSITQVLSYIIEIVYPELKSPHASRSQSSAPQQQSENSAENSDESSLNEQSKEESKKAESSKEESKAEESSKEESKTEENSKEESKAEESSEVKADNSLTVTEDMRYGLGDENDNIIKIQNRLIELGYFSDVPTGYFGELSVSAFKEFEEKNNIDADGYASSSDLKLLFSADAKTADS